MELVPALQIGWLNGWVLLCLLFSVFGVLMLAFPKDVVARLYDRSDWSRIHIVFTVIGKLLALVWFSLIVFTPLKTGSGLFILGIAIFALGLVGLVIALFNYKDTPLGQPVTGGIYKISRNPQIVMLIASFCGISIAVGSWLAVFVLLVSLVFNHFRILAEEKACLKQYGDSYCAYMKRVPRYFLFF